MIFVNLYLENYDKSSFVDLENCAGNYYVLNKSGQQKTVTAV